MNLFLSAVRFEFAQVDVGMDAEGRITPTLVMALKNSSVSRLLKNRVIFVRTVFRHG